MSARRRAVAAEFRERAAEAAVRHLEASPEYLRCARLVVYSALSDELPLPGVVDRAKERRKRLLWPRLVDAEQLVFSWVERVERFLRCRYGLLEPPATSPGEPLGPDVLVLVPGVAFDALGGRLGRGRGLWDRALADPQGAVTFGVGYEFQCVERVPREAHDRPVDALLTEVGIRRVRSS